MTPYRLRAALTWLLLTACTPPTAPRATTTLQVSGGRLSIFGRLGERTAIELRNAEVRARIDGTLRSSADSICTSSADAAMRCDLGEGLSLVLQTAQEKDGLLLTAAVSGAGHRVDGFELVATRSVDSGIVLANAAGPLRYLHNGYQSWSFSGVLEVPDGSVLPRANGALVYGAPNGNVATDETAGLSSHSVILDAGDGSAMLVGFVSTLHWQSAIGLEASEGRRQLTAINGFTGDGLLTDAEIRSETLLVQYAASPAAAMTAYGEALQARQLHPERPFNSENGWFSWNRFFESIDEEEALAQADAMRQLVGTEGFDLVEIDDGWETAWGDWTPNAKFSDIARLAETVHAKGQRLGLWVAPFVVEDTTPIVDAHPDWWVKKADGQPLIHAPILTPHHLRIVDLSNPEARAWAVENLVALERAGVDFLKLDYLYAGAFDGKRSDPQATGVSALREGLDAIFAGLQHASVNLCGVPWLHAALAPPSTIRVGADVSLGGAPYGFVLVSTAARNLSARAFGPLSRRSDPDQFLLAPLTPDERQTALLFQAIAGESFALGDDLVNAEADLKEAIRAAAPLRRVDGPMMVKDLFASPAAELVGTPVQELLVDPDHVSSPPPSVLVRGEYLLATNWSDSVADIDLRLESKQQATAVWGPAPSGGSVRLAPHASTLLRVARTGTD